MSIFAGMDTIGEDCDGNRTGEVLEYVGSPRHPDGTQQPGTIDLSVIPDHCVPGHDNAQCEATGEWVRLSLVTTYDDNGVGPWIAKGGTALLNVQAARDLAARLIAWADSPHVAPKAPDV